MRILFVSITWPLDTALVQLIRGLAQTGVVVSLASPKRPTISWFPELKVEWLPLPSVSENKTALITKVWQTAVWDIIYFDSVMAALFNRPLFDRGFPIIVRCSGIDVFVTPHLPDQQPFINGLNTIFQNASALHFATEAIKREAARYSLDLAKAFVIPPGVNLKLFKPLKENSFQNERYRMVTSGPLIWQNGHEYAIQTIRHLVDKDVSATLDILGRGREGLRLRYTIHDLELDHRVHIIGSLPRVDFRDWLQKSNVYLVTSLTDDIDAHALEAMACGIPIVTNDFPSMREAITNGVEGVVVPVREPEMMASKLASLASDPELFQRMSEAARQRVVDQFTFEKHLGKFMTMCQAVQ